MKPSILTSATYNILLEGDNYTYQTLLMRIGSPNGIRIESFQNCSEIPRSKAGIRFNTEPGDLSFPSLPLLPLHNEKEKMAILEEPVQTSVTDETTGHCQARHLHLEELVVHAAIRVKQNAV